MSLQNELSNRARSPEEVAEARKEAELIASIAAKQKAQETAKHKAAEITSEIKKLLLENVHAGNYTKRYNKGTVSCYVVIPKRKYLTSTQSIISDKKTYKYIATRYQFLTNKDSALEFEFLNQVLHIWGDNNQVEINWVVRAPGIQQESPFPCEEPQTYSSVLFESTYELTVKATTHFAIDSNYPIDYLSDADRADKKKKEVALEEWYQKECNQKKKEWFQFRVTAILSAVCTVVLLFLGLCNEFSSIFIAILVSAFVSFWCLTLSSNSNDEYEEAKAKLEEHHKKNQV